MPNTYITDLRHFLDIWDPGVVVPKEARRFAEYVGKMALAYTAVNPHSGMVVNTAIPCHRRPGRRPCPGRLWLVNANDPREPAFLWECPSCHERGRTTGFVDTPWDLGRRREPGGPLVRMTITEADYRQLDASDWFDEDIDRIVYGATLAPEGVTLVGTLDEFNMFVDELAGHANHMPKAKSRELDGVLRVLGDHLARLEANRADVVPFHRRAKKADVPRLGYEAGGPDDGQPRVLRKGNLVFVGGVMAHDVQGKVSARNDPYAQTRQCLKNMEADLLKLEAVREDVLRVRVYVTKIAYRAAVRQAFVDLFGARQPIISIIEVSALEEAGALVMIEAEGVVDE